VKLLKHTAMAVTLAASLVTTGAYAQQKIGVVNVQEIFQRMPQAATLQQTVTTEFKDEIDAVQRMEKDLQYFLEKQRRDTATMSPEEITQLEQQIIALRNEYAAKAQPLQENIQRRSNEERNKLLALIQQSINAVAANESYDVILNAGAVTFITDEHELSIKVIDELNKPVVSNPAN